MRRDGVRDAPRHFLGRLEDEGERPGRTELQDAVLPVVHARMAGQFGQVAAQQRQQVPLVDLADLAQASGGRLVVEVAHERVARIGGDRRHASCMQDLRGLLEQAGLRVVRVDFEQLRHAGIVYAPTSRQSGPSSAMAAPSSAGDSRARITKTGIAAR